jgi:hypothetical protein
LAKLFDLNSDTAFQFDLFPFYDAIRTKYSIEFNQPNARYLSNSNY